MCALLGLTDLTIDRSKQKGPLIGNCSVTILDYGETIQVERIADTSFVEKGMKGESYGIS